MASKGGRAIHTLSAICDDFAIICGHHHRLARKGTVRLPALKGQTWSSGHAAAALRRPMDLLAQDLGQPLACTGILSRLPTVNRRRLRQTDALMLLPRSVLRQYIEAGELAVLRLERHMPFEAIGMLLPEEGAGAETERLARFLKEFHAKR